MPDNHVHSCRAHVVVLHAIYICHVHRVEHSHAMAFEQVQVLPGHAVKIQDAVPLA